MKIPENLPAIYCLKSCGSNFALSRFDCKARQGIIALIVKKTWLIVKNFHLIQNYTI
jgi:hypothetical protein